jgi:hypothetical protein
MIRAWRAIWTFGLPAFNLTVCGLPTRMDGYLEIVLEYF